MILDLTKADFVAALPFSTQIEDQQIRASITDSYVLDVLPELGHETLEKLQALPAFTVTPYLGVDSLPGVKLNDLLVRRERVYQALVAAPTAEVPVLATVVQLTQTPLTPAPDPSGQWLFRPLETLWSQYLKAYWLQAAYVRFLLNHGVNVTKAGLTVPADREKGTYDRPSSAQVAQMLADARTTAEARLSRLTRFLSLNGLLYFYDPQTGGGGYGGLGADGYERVPGDPPLAPGQRLAPNRRRHSSRFRGV